MILLRHKMTHRLVNAILVVLLILTGQSMAIARGAAGPAGQMELCTGTGPVMVYVDADGNPIETPRYCPEGAMAVLLGIDVPAPMLAPPTAVRRALTLTETPQIAHAAVRTPQARAPPVEF